MIIKSTEPPERLGIPEPGFYQDQSQARPSILNLLPLFSSLILKFFIILDFVFYNFLLEICYL